MAEPIKVGDLVMVVRGHECVTRIIGGKIFSVVAIYHQIGGGWYCPKCQTRSIAPDDKWGAAWDDSGKNALPLSFLKRIPPPGELEDEKRDEEITA